MIQPTQWHSSTWLTTANNILAQALWLTDLILCRFNYQPFYHNFIMYFIIQYWIWCSFFQLIFFTYCRTSVAMFTVFFVISLLVSMYYCNNKCMRKQGWGRAPWCQFDYQTKQTVSHPSSSSWYWFGTSVNLQIQHAVTLWCYNAVCCISEYGLTSN